MATDTVYFENHSWTYGVNVEIRKGNNANPEENPSLGIHNIEKDASFEVASEGEDLWWRRDADPDHPDGRMQAEWTHRPCYGNGDEYHEEIL